MSEDLNKPGQGWKADKGKVRFDLIPPELLFGVGTILTFGAEKYGDRNWEKGMNYSRAFAAMMRHMWAWWGGKEPTSRNFIFGTLDPETKHSHLWHAGCCLSFLIAFEDRGMTQLDDRPNHVRGPEDAQH
nr:dATP/dGTP diphosphohydrolase domain-containing protein [uncultured Cohaesibacter sp.]